MCFISTGDIQSSDIDHNSAFQHIECLRSNLCLFGTFTCNVWDDPELMNNCIKTLNEQKKLKQGDSLLVMGLAHGSWHKTEGNNGFGTYNCGSYSHNTMLTDLSDLAEQGVNVGAIFDSCSQGELQKQLLQANLKVQSNLCLSTSSTYGALSYGSPIYNFLETANKKKDAAASTEEKKKLTNLYDLGKLHALQGGTFSGFPYNFTKLKKALVSNDIREFIEYFWV